MTLQDLKDKLEKGPDTWFKVFDKATGKVVAVTEAINDEKITYRFRVPANCDMKQIEKEEYDQLKTMLKNATLN